MNEPSCSSSISDIQQVLQSILKSSINVGVPGISASVGTSKGIAWQSTAGLADIENQVPVVSNNIFGIGSITKVFTAVVILQLVEEKLLKLSDIVSDHLEGT